MTSTTTSPTPRRKRLLLAVTVVVAVLAAVVVALSWGTSASAGVRPGRAWEVSSLTPDEIARTLRVELPVGGLDVSVGKPVEEVPGYDVETDDAPEGPEIGEDARSGDDARFVPISWQLDGDPGTQRTLPVYQFHVTLVADGRRYDLRAGSSTVSPVNEYNPVLISKAMYVVVAGDATDLQVEVEYDGVTQVADVDAGEVDKGLAEPLYDPAASMPRVPTRGCDLFTEAQRDDLELDFGFDCIVGQVELSPYFRGLGWVNSAEESWAAVAVEVQALSTLESEQGNYYTVSRSPVDVRLDDARPTKVLFSHTSEEGLSATYVFRTGTDPGALRLGVDFTATREYGRREPAVIRFGGEQRFPLR